MNMSQFKIKLKSFNGRFVLFEKISLSWVNLHLVTPYIFVGTVMQQYLVSFVL